MWKIWFKAIFIFNIFLSTYTQIKIYILQKHWLKKIDIFQFNSTDSGNILVWVKIIGKVFMNDQNCCKDKIATINKDFERQVYMKKIIKELNSEKILTCESSTNWQLNYLFIFYYFYDNKFYCELKMISQQFYSIVQEQQCHVSQEFLIVCRAKWNKGQWVLMVGSMIQNKKCHSCYLFHILHHLMWLNFIRQ